MPQETPKITDFQSIRIKIASPEEILSWSYGEVLKPETINYRTQKPEKDGLFCERIFGPSKDWECYCGKYRRIRYKGVICDKCGVEVTRAIVRRERMGHIKLAAPVCHIWFLRGVPSRIGLILDLPLPALERVIYYAAYIVTKVDEQAKAEAFKEIEREYKSKLKEMKETKEALKAARDQAVQELQGIKKYQIISEIDYRRLSEKYGEIFEAGIGSEAVRKLLEEIDLKELERKLSAEAEKKSLIQKKKTLKRLKLVRGFLNAGIRPEWMFLTVLPVLPPDLRPMVQLDGGRYASSDLNDLYRRVINRNNRLKKLQELRAPEVITRNEKRMLQEAVDALIDNSIRRGQGPVPTSAAQKRPLRSLADMLKGKQGRFRQNLLGKRVDYSGRSVIVIGPELKLSECGLPKKMALELFKPFVINKLVEREIAHNIRAAGRLIEEAPNIIWALLEEVIQDRYVLLNRAPTLHRLGIQAFKPVLIEGFAIRIHPLVCTAFNADFDGDQMAVHLPLTEEAQAEAKNIMLSSLNLLKPATGEPIVDPSKDIIFGCYFMSRIVPGLKGEGKVFGSPKEAILAYQFGEVALKARIKVRIDKPLAGADSAVPSKADSEKKRKFEVKQSKIIETCVGRLIFNDIFPPEMPFINEELKKKVLSGIVGEVIDRFGTEKAGEIFDAIKNLGFEYATQSGISWGMDDLRVPEEKAVILSEGENEVKQIWRQYSEGLLTEEERKNMVIQVWQKVVDKIKALVPGALDPEGSVFSIINSRARGTEAQLVQMSGIKGLVANPAGETIELPIKNSYKEGLNVLEYFIVTHGARKGTADTALRTASAGYLTRRLVDVAQDVTITEEDCKDSRGVEIWRRDSEETNQSFSSRIFSRTVLEDVIDPATKKVLVKKGDIIDKKTAQLIEDAKLIEKVLVRSPMTCRSLKGVCQKCYGYDLGNNSMVKIGEAVGIVAAQAIGEPGTQLTMRTFHTGGMAGGADITQGLPRVQEIFEVRIPKGKAVISETAGVVEDIEDKGKQKIIRIRVTGEESAKPSKSKKTKKTKKSAETREYVVASNAALWVKKGDEVEPGVQLCEGSIDLKELFKACGSRRVERYILNEIQKIYTTQGAPIHDKHIEIIIRQMFSRVRVKETGDSNLTPGEVLEKSRFLEINNTLLANKKKPAKAVQLLLGITKVALSTESFLSAASFQETARVLISAACEGKEDNLYGLKENVIIGRLIPAGTGFRSLAEKKQIEEENLES